MSRILVTGGAGRLGRTLVAGLADAGHEVVSLDRDVSDAAELADVAQVAVDLTDADAASRAIADARPTRSCTSRRSPCRSARPRTSSCARTRRSR